jgi:hypothetical protein
MEEKPINVGMGLNIQLDGHPGQAFEQVIRALPDGRSWMLSDLEGRVIIARHEGEELFREAILSAGETNGWDVECLASKGVSEFAVMGLVGLAIASSLGAVVWVWLYGPSGVLGFALGMVLASGVPSGVITIGQRILDPGREERAERNLQRAVRHAVAVVPTATLVSTDD